MDVEKTMEFLLEHHARFAAEMEELKERVKEHDRVLAKHDEQIAQLTDLVGRVAQAGLVLNQRLVEVTERLDNLSGRLDALIVVVEKYLGRL
jgi:cell division septum initiation protein DivIVA